VVCLVAKNMNVVMFAQEVVTKARVHLAKSMSIKPVAAKCRQERFNAGNLTLNSTNVRLCVKRKEVVGNMSVIRFVVNLELLPYFRITNASLPAIK